MFSHYCTTCDNQIHFAAVYDKHADAERALELVGWVRERGKLRCRACAQQEQVAPRDEGRTQ